MVPFKRALVSSYRISIVTFPLSLRVSEILPFLCSILIHLSLLHSCLVEFSRVFSKHCMAVFFWLTVPASAVGRGGASPRWVATLFSAAWKLHMCFSMRLFITTKQHLQVGYTSESLADKNCIKTENENWIDYDNLIHWIKQQLAAMHQRWRLRLSIIQHTISATDNMVNNQRK